MAGPTLPTTWTELCNAALARLNAGQISDYDSDTSNKADQCRLHLPLILEEILGCHDWNGVSKRAELNENATPPDFGYDHAFDLPADFIRFCGEDEQDVDEYIVEGNQILTDAEEVYIRYVFGPAAFSDLPGYILPAIIAALAARLCKHLTSNDALQRQIQTEYEDPAFGALARAKSADARFNQQISPNQEDHVWHDELR
jgi:hypothetical protein